MSPALAIAGRCPNHAPVVTPASTPAPQRRCCTVASLSLAVPAWRLGMPALRAGARRVVEDEFACGPLAALQARHVDLRKLQENPASQRGRRCWFALPRASGNPPAAPSHLVSRRDDPRRRFQKLTPSRALNGQLATRTRRRRVRRCLPRPALSGRSDRPRALCERVAGRAVLPGLVRRGRRGPTPRPGVTRRRSRPWRS